MGWLKRREFRSSCPEDSTLWSLRSLMPKRSPWRVAQAVLQLLMEADVEGVIGAA
jgi:hypothetical protein